MRIVIGCSRDWFQLDNSLNETHEIMMISNKSDLTTENLHSFCPDIVFFPHWNWIVSSTIYENFKCIIFHTAPLPYGRGGSPIQNLILRGFRRAPVCALEMGSILDGGDIYGKIEIDLNGTLTDIFSRLNGAVNSLIKQILRNDPTPIPQAGPVVEFKRLGGADNQIPIGLSVDEVFDRIRMLDHEEYPNAFIKIGNYEVQFSNAEISGKNVNCVARISIMDKESE